MEKGPSEYLWHVKCCWIRSIPVCESISGLWPRKLEFCFYLPISFLNKYPSQFSFFWPILYKTERDFCISFCGHVFSFHLSYKHLGMILAYCQVDGDFIWQESAEEFVEMGVLFYTSTGNLSQFQLLLILKPFKIA